MGIQHTFRKLEAQERADDTQSCFRSHYEILIPNQHVAVRRGCNLASVDLETAAPVLGCAINVPICEFAAVKRLNGRANHGPRVAHDMYYPCVRKARAYLPEPENMCRALFTPSAFALARSYRPHH